MSKKRLYKASDYWRAETTEEKVVILKYCASHGHFATRERRLSLRVAFNNQKSVKFPMWDRFCDLCGEPAAVRHHIQPLIRGGENGLINVCFLCRGCHTIIHPWLASAEPEQSPKSPSA